MSQDNNVRCPKCKYYERRKSAQDGICRLKPPSVGTTIDVKGVGRLETSWPIVKDTDWCGEHTKAS